MPAFLFLPCCSRVITLYMCKFWVRSTSLCINLIEPCNSRWGKQGRNHLLLLTNGIPNLNINYELPVGQGEHTGLPTPNLLCSTTLAVQRVSVKYPPHCELCTVKFALNTWPVSTKQCEQASVTKKKKRWWLPGWKVKTLSENKTYSYAARDVWGLFAPLRIIIHEFSIWLWYREPRLQWPPYLC